MSDDVIRVGDLVVVVKGHPCCGNAEFVGKLFKVEQIGTFECECHDCGRVFSSETVFSSWSFRELGSLVKKIKPLDENVEDAVLVPEVVGV